MTQIIEERYGLLLLHQLFTHIWFGKWGDYEQTIDQLPDDLIDQLPFHHHYDREETKLWHDNYFNIPGKYFMPPYISSYEGKNEEAKQDLLCLIGMYEQLGFYYPLEQHEFPDHIGSLTAYMTAALAEEIKAMENNDGELVKYLQDNQCMMYEQYIKSGLQKMWEMNQRKITDSFFKSFFPYVMDTMQHMVIERKIQLKGDE